MFPALQHDRLALLTNGKNDRLTRKDFRTFAGTAGIAAGAAEAAIEDVVSRLDQVLDAVELPDGLAYQAKDRSVAGKILAICRTRTASLG